MMRLVLDREVRLEELEEGVTARRSVLAGGCGSGLDLRLRGLSGVERGELGCEVRGERGCLRLGRERVRFDDADVCVLCLHEGQIAPGSLRNKTHLGRGLVRLELAEVQVLDEVWSSGALGRCARRGAGAGVPLRAMDEVVKERETTRACGQGSSATGGLCVSELRGTYGAGGLPEERRGHGRKGGTCDGVTVTAEFWDSRLASVRAYGKRRAAAEGLSFRIRALDRSYIHRSTPLRTQNRPANMLARITSVSARRLPRVSPVATRFYTEQNSFKYVCRFDTCGLVLNAVVCL